MSEKAIIKPTTTVKESTTIKESTPANETRSLPSEKGSVINLPKTDKKVIVTTDGTGPKTKK